MTERVGVRVTSAKSQRAGGWCNAGTMQHTKITPEPQGEPIFKIVSFCRSFHRYKESVS